MALSIKGRRWPLLLSAVGLVGLGGAALAQAGLSSPGQAQAGANAYAQNCAACHGSDMTNGQFAPPLKGGDFLAKWGGQPVGKLLDYMHTSMPPTNPGGLPDATYSAIAAFIVQQNGGTAAMLPTAPVRARGEAGVGGLSTRVYPLPPGPKIPDRFAGFTPVTEAELDNPAPENWPAWRRSHLGLGYSPLNQINTSNVASLHIAWAQALPPGDNMNEPLVRDGVLYVFGFGDNVFAFDAASGRQ
ncbi:MAG: c-type cytochrome, partial [Croceibacterium sp.]